MNFRHMLETHQLQKKLFEEIKAHLQEQGLMMQEGTIVDATLITASGSTKNAEKKRDPEMASTKKGNQYIFGMKAHVGVCATGDPLVHTVKITPANVHDSVVMDNLVQGEERILLGDKAYHSLERRETAEAKGIAWAALEKAARGHPLDGVQELTNQIYSKFRARVEYPFQVVKHLWGHRKVRYKGLHKNACQLEMLFGLANLYLARRKLLRMA